VSERDAQPTLVDCGFTETADDPLPHERARQVAACLDCDPAALDDGLLPMLWHWTYFHPAVPTAALGIDGHPQRRPEMAEFPQRMWVGGRVRVARPLRIGVDAQRTSRVVSTDLKDGNAGRFWLVTVGHVVEQAGAACIEEEQDIVFRAAGALAPVGPDADAAPDAAWVEERIADPRLLFRFSAVTGNAHRIHYDHPYATAVEGYPDLVVHGPLTAVLLAGMARERRGRDATTVSFRARAPHFANRRFWLAGSPTDDGGAALAAIRADGTTSMTLEVH
jgi:3-methylfumaryl-CoA hydratase